MCQGNRNILRASSTIKRFGSPFLFRIRRSMKGDLKSRMKIASFGQEREGESEPWNHHSRVRFQIVRRAQGSAYSLLYFILRASIAAGSLFISALSIVVLHHIIQILPKKCAIRQVRKPAGIRWPACSLPYTYLDSGLFRSTRTEARQPVGSL